MSMNAVVIHGPRDIRIEKRPIPSIQEPRDAIVKVQVAGICGSELHPYRGHQTMSFGHIMGHEFIGIVESIGDSVTTVKPGERVLGLFSTSCLRCWFCTHGHTNRCSVSLAFGTPQIDGAQAEYVRVPEADGTLLHTPADIPDELLVMMSDIFPTGYYGAMRAIQNFGPPSTADGTATEQAAGTFTAKLQPIDAAVFVCIGCGIVGLSAAATAVAKGVKTVFCVDSVEDRLEQARRLGGIPLHLGVDDIGGTVMKATDGRGADAVVESVGNKPALQSAYELLRPCGYISSVGYHQTELPFTGRDGYQRNITINMGRAPVRTVIRDAMETFMQVKSGFDGAVSHRLPLADAAEGFRLFDTQEARKVILDIQ